MNTGDCVAGGVAIVCSGETRETRETSDTNNTTTIGIDHSVADCRRADVAICRYCLESEPLADLIAPCMCRGHSQWVHKACLRRWHELMPPFAVTGAATPRPLCEICRTRFTLAYTPIPAVGSAEQQHAVVQSPAPEAHPPAHIWNGPVLLDLCKFTYVLAIAHIAYLFLILIMKPLLGRHRERMVVAAISPQSISDEEASTNIAGHALLICSFLYLPVSVVRVAVARARAPSQRSTGGMGGTAMSCFHATCGVIRIPLITLLIPLVVGGYVLLYTGLYMPLPIVCSLVIYDIHYSTRLVLYNHLDRPRGAQPPHVITGNAYVIHATVGEGGT